MIHISYSQRILVIPFRNSEKYKNRLLSSSSAQQKKKKKKSYNRSGPHKPTKSLYKDLNQRI